LGSSYHSFAIIYIWKGTGEKMTRNGEKEQKDEERSRKIREGLSVEENIGYKIEGRKDGREGRRGKSHEIFQPWGEKWKGKIRGRKEDGKGWKTEKHAL
jgi:hypothetical protein